MWKGENLQTAEKKGGMKEGKNHQNLKLIIELTKKLKEKPE